MKVRIIVLLIVFSLPSFVYALDGFVSDKTINDFQKLNYTPNITIDIIHNNEYYYNSEGELIKKQYIPPYYNQKDKRWKDISYNDYTLGSFGCTPTSLAMAFTSILEKKVLPTEIADYLYNNTTSFNYLYGGSDGMAIIHAVKHYNVNYLPLDSIYDIKNSLKDGKIVYGAIAKGKFSPKDWNHAIIMYGYKDNKTYVLDPLSKKNNGWYPLKQIFNDKSLDEEDYMGGAIFYGLG